jgi:hypothetical protein
LRTYSELTAAHLNDDALNYESALLGAWGPLPRHGGNPFGYWRNASRRKSLSRLDSSLEAVTKLQSLEKMLDSSSRSAD